MLRKTSQANFFSVNRVELKSYSSAPDSKKKNLPGAAYIKKVLGHYNLHYGTGELYMEYLKGSCKEKSWGTCVTFVIAVDG